MTTPHVKQKPEMPTAYVVASFAAVPFILAGLRVYIFSGGDPVVLRVVLQSLDVPGVLLGTLVPALPGVFYWVAYLTLIGQAWGTLVLFARGGGAWRVGLIAVFFGLGLLTTSFGSLRMLGYTAAGCAAGFVISIVLLRVRKARDRAISVVKAITPSRRRYLISFAVVLSLTSLLQLVSAGGMWLPKERLTAANGRSLAVGYVLQVADSWTTVLGDNRAVLRLRSADVARRDVCGQGEYQSALSWFAHPDGLKSPC